MCVSLAPVQAVGRILAHPYWVAHRFDPAIGTGDLEAIDAFVIKADPLDNLHDFATGVQRLETIAIESDHSARHSPGGAIAVVVFPADRQIELFPRFDDRWHNRCHPRGVVSQDLKARPARRQEVALAVEVNVDREHGLIGRERLHPPALRPLAPITVDDRHAVSGLERARCYLERGHVHRRPETAVHASPGNPSYIQLHVRI